MRFFDTQFLQCLCSDGTGNNPAGCFTRTAAPAATVVAVAIFLLVGVVSVRRPERSFKLLVVVGVLVDVVVGVIVGVLVGVRVEVGE